MIFDRSLKPGAARGDVITKEAAADIGADRETGGVLLQPPTFPIGNAEGDRRQPRFIGQGRAARVIEAN